jgi:hypothetical protein
LQNIASTSGRASSGVRHNLGVNGTRTGRSTRLGASAQFSLNKESTTADARRPGRFVPATSTVGLSRHRQSPTDRSPSSARGSAIAGLRVDTSVGSPPAERCCR